MTQILETKRSSFIKQLVYDKAEKHLTAYFKNGARYRYYDVSQQKFSKFKTAESIGSYFATKIKGQYKSRRIKKATN